MMKNKQTLWITGIIALFVFAHSCAQKPNILPKNEFGLTVIKNTKSYIYVITMDSNKIMKKIGTYLPQAALDLRYATKQNFMHREMYAPSTNTSFLRLPVIRALQKVEESLAKQGLGLKIFDAYRPYSVTQKFWELVHDDRYVANPAKGSGHNRGIAVDLTLIDLKTKQALDMGTDFDNFTDSAHQSFTSLPRNVLENRKLLKETMVQFGFNPLETEWWHYSWPNAEKFEILDLSFDTLLKTKTN
jgi:D-alanyl-D-alanine dipeptidase